MKFNLSGLISLVTWVAFTVAMLNSGSLWFNDLYLLVGYLIWSLVFVLPFLTEGRQRLFWLTIALTIVAMRLQPHVLSTSFGWTANFLNVSEGGTRFGAFGHDVLTANGVTPQATGGIPGTLYWTFQTINGPLVIGSLLGIVRANLERAKWLIAVLPLVLCFSLFWIDLDPFWFKSAKLAFQVCVIFAVTIPLTVERRGYPFALGLAGVVGTCQLIYLSSSARFPTRPVERAIYQVHLWRGIAPDEVDIRTMAQITSLILPVVLGLVFGFFVQALWKPSTDDAE